jgi:hypothetical protein
LMCRAFVIFGVLIGAAGCNDSEKSHEVPVSESRGDDRSSPHSKATDVTKPARAIATH